MNGINRLKFHIEFSKDEDTPEIITLNQLDDALKFEDRYEALQTLGQGAHAVVKVARKKDTDEIFAVKIVRSSDQEIQNNVKRTFNNTRCLRHPNITQDIELFINEKMETSYLIMEYCSFPSLESLIKQRPLTEKEVKIIMKQLLLAISHAHQKGICHRDLKPDNVLVDLTNIDDESSQVRVKVVDFGVSRRFMSKGQEIEMLTKTGNVFYCAPEIYHKSSYSKEVDIWSIGVIIFQCLVQKLPLHSNDMLDFIDLLKQPEKWTFKDTLRDLPISIALRSLLLRMLTYDPQQRISAEVALESSFFDSGLLMISQNLDQQSSPLLNHLKQLQTSLGVDAAKFDNNLGEVLKKLKNNNEQVDLEELVKEIGNIHIVQKPNQFHGGLIQLMNSINSSNIYQSRLASKTELSFGAQNDALKKFCDKSDPFGSFTLQESQEFNEDQVIEQSPQKVNKQNLQSLGTHIDSSITLPINDDQKITITNQQDGQSIQKRSSFLNSFLGELGIKEVDEITEEL